MGIRPLSAVFDFREEVDRLMDEAAAAGMDADIIISEVRGRADLAEGHGLPFQREKEERREFEEAQRQEERRKLENEAMEEHLRPIHADSGGAGEGGR